MIIKLVVLASILGSTLPLASAEPRSLVAEDEGDLNPQPLPPFTGDDIVVALT